MSEGAGRSSRGGPGIAGFALLALIALSLLFGAFTVFATIRAERAQRAQVAQTNAALDALRDIGMAVINAETGQRGYLLTLDRRYLTAYQLGAASYPEALRRLHRTLDPQASSNQRQLMHEVERLADAKFAELAATVSLVDDGRAIDARALVLSDEGQQLMTQLRATLGELERIEFNALRAAASKSAASEARTLPVLGCLVALIVLALALGLVQVARTARAETAAANAAQLAEARDRADLLARELNHRVGNLFAVILALVKMSARREPDAKPVIDKVVQRIEALSRSHQVTQGKGGEAVADLKTLVETALKPYRGAGNSIEIEGEPVTLRGDLAMPLGLVLHELVTNAVKYGALRSAQGRLEVSWGQCDGRIDLRWRECGSDSVAPQQSEGFGSLLMTSSARQLRGTIEREFAVDGLLVQINFPLDRNQPPH